MSHISQASIRVYIPFFLNHMTWVLKRTAQRDSKNVALALYTTNESQEVSPFPSGDHKAQINRRTQRHNKHKTEKNIKIHNRSIAHERSEISHWRAQTGPKAPTSPLTHSQSDEYVSQKINTYLKSSLTLRRHWNPGLAGLKLMSCKMMSCP